MASLPKKIFSSNPQALTRVYAWFSALVTNDLAMLEDLYTHGVPVDIFHPLRQTTALMEATRLGRAPLVEWFLARGASPAFLCGAPLCAPLHTALRRQHWEIALLLTKAMETTAIIDSYGRTPLHVLCMEAQENDLGSSILELATLIVSKYCPLDALDYEGITALHHCVINNAKELGKLLLTRGAKADALIPDSWVSPLTIAALEKNLEMAELLLLHGANPYLRTREGLDPVGIYPAIRDLVQE